LVPKHKNVDGMSIIWARRDEKS